VWDCRSFPLLVGSTPDRLTFANSVWAPGRLAGLWGGLGSELGLFGFFTAPVLGWLIEIGCEGGRMIPRIRSTTTIL
jgi:hypothetical protein